MMNMLDTLRRTGGLEALSRVVELSPSNTTDGARVLLPLVLAGYKRLSHMFGPSHHGLLDMVVRIELRGGAQLATLVLLQGEMASDAPGKALAVELYGGPDGVLAVERVAARRSDIESAKLHKMLPLLVMLVGGFIASRADHTEGNGSSVAELLDLDRPGNPLDAILPASGS